MHVIFVARDVCILVARDFCIFLWRDGSYEHTRHWFYEELARNINSPFICRFSVRSWIDSLNELHHEITVFGLHTCDTSLIIRETPGNEP